MPAPAVPSRSHPQDLDHCRVAQFGKHGDEHLPRSRRAARRSDVDEVTDGPALLAQSSSQQRRLPPPGGRLVQPPDGG